MTFNYYYLVASLPVLKLDGNVRMTSEFFLELCTEHVRIHDYEIIKHAIIDDFSNVLPNTVFEKWQAWERDIRNQLVLLRPQRLELDSALFLRGNKDSIIISPDVRKIFEAPSPIAAENLLYNLRWCFLNELEIGHYFDCNTLILYYLKIQLIEKRQRLTQENGERQLQELELME